MPKGNEDRKWHLKNMRWITNERFSGQVWLSNILNTNVTSTNVHYFLSTTQLVASKPFSYNLYKYDCREKLENVFDGKSVSSFHLMNGDVVNEIDFNLFFMLSNYARKNKIRINLRKGEIVKYGKKHRQITKDRSNRNE